MSVKKDERAIIPPKTDPIWIEIVERGEAFKVSALPTKMLLMRISLMRKNRTPQSLHDSVDAVFDFFNKNQDAVRDDIVAIFGKIETANKGSK